MDIMITLFSQEEVWDMRERSITDVNDDLCDLKGKLYCVSYSRDSYKELCAVEDSLEAEGIKCAELGIYDDGYATGLQHEIIIGR